MFKFAAVPADNLNLSMPYFIKRYSIWLWLGLILAILSRNTAALPATPSTQREVKIKLLTQLRPINSKSEQQQATCCLITEEPSDDDLTRFLKQPAFTAFAFTPFKILNFTSGAIIKCCSGCKIIPLFILHRLLRI